MTTRTLFRRISWILLLTATVAGAQQAPVFHSRSELVQVPVIVLDRKGQFVDGLKRGDFDLKVDGRPVQITALDRQRKTVQTAATAAPTPPNVYSNRAARAQAGRLVLVYDYDHTPLQFLPRLRLRLMQWFQHSLPPGEQVAVFALNHGLEVLQPFTSDRNALEATLDQMVSFHTVTNRYSFLRQELSELNRQAGFSTEPGASPPAPGAVDMSLTANGSIAASAQWSAADLQRVENVLTRGRYYSAMQALSDLATLLAGVPGRKSVVWFTAGTTLNAVWNNKLGIAGRQRDLTFSRLNQADVALYPVDVTGLRSLTLRSSPLATFTHPELVGIRRQVAQGWKQIGMGTAAEWTGGQAIPNTNGFGRALTRIVRTTAESYVISFVPPEPRKGHPWRSLALTVPGRKHLTVLARRQYLQPEVAEANRASEEDFASSLRRLALEPMDLGSLPLALRALPPGDVRAVRLKKDGPLTPTRPHGFVLIVPYHRLLHAAPDAAGGYAFDFTCYRVLVPLDHPGQIMIFQPGRFSHQLTAPQRAQLDGEAAIYRNVFPVPAGHIYLARIVVRDNLTGQLGSVSFRIDTRK